MCVYIRACIWRSETNLWSLFSLPSSDGLWLSNSGWQACITRDKHLYPRSHLRTPVIHLYCKHLECWFLLQISKAVGGRCLGPFDSDRALPVTGHLEAGSCHQRVASRGDGLDGHYSNTPSKTSLCEYWVSLKLFPLKMGWGKCQVQS